MQTTRRERLMRMASDEPAHGVATTVKCGACIGLLALLSVIGFGTGVNDAASPVAASTARNDASAHVGIRAEAHRKQVFDERRARFDGAAPARIAMTPDRGGVFEVIAP